MDSDTALADITLTIRLFGAFRQYDTGEPLRLKLPAGADLPAVKGVLTAALAERHPGFSDQALVEAAALATDDAILPADTTITNDQTLAVLPPVCGG